MLSINVVNLAKISKAKLNLAITGIAGPKGGTKKSLWFSLYRN